MGDLHRVAASISEAERLALLASYAPDTLQDDPELEAITRFAARLAEAPTALISLVEADRQRFLAREGLEAAETPRSVSFCQYAMVQDGMMVVPDAREDSRFAANELVTGPPHVRFYAGAPLVGDGGEPLGSLCVISPEPRPGGLTDLQREGLTVLARAVMRRLIDRRAHLASQASQARFEALGDAMPQMAWSTTRDGMVDYFNKRWEEFTGVPSAEHFGTGWIEALHPEDRETAIAAWMGAVASGRPYEVEYRLRRHDGEWRWTLARGLPVTAADGTIERWFGTNTDIHEGRMLLESRDLLARELSHRVKNIFSVVLSLLHLEARAEPAVAGVLKGVADRIAALGRAHDYVRPGGRGDGGKRTSLKGVLGELFAAYDCEDGPRVRIEGDDADIGEEAVTALALLFHELATNAAKYGALSRSDGAVVLTISRDGKDTAFTWAERGGPDARDGERRAGGFGSRLMATAVELQLRGRLERTWGEDGLTVRATVPTGRLSPGPA